MLRKAYEYKKRRKAKLFRNIGILLFFCVLLIGMVLGMIIPLRPTVSDQEKRELTKFPKIQEVSFLDGEYFKQVDAWYAGTYPFRDELLAGNQAIKSLYGLHTEQIHGSVTGGDEIPDVIDGGSTTELPSSGGDNGSEDPQNEENTPVQTSEADGETVSETEESTEAESSEPETIGEADIPNAGGVVADELKPQVQGKCISGWIQSICIILFQ